MPHVQASAQIAVDPDALWREVGSFQGVGEWHPLLAHVYGEGELPGSLRMAKTLSGQEQIERLREISPRQRYYRYALMSSPMPVRSYVGDFRVRDNHDGTSTVLWTSDFQTRPEDEARTVGLVREFMTAGVENLKKRFT